jgi:hypothetical protein
MLNYQHLKFYSELSEKRMGKANEILGEKVVKHILAFAFFLLGAHRRAIAELLNMPQDTLKSFIERVFRIGITAFEDGRRKVSAFLPLGAVVPGKPSAFLEYDRLIADFGMPDRTVTVPAKNKLQVKTILLTMVSNRLIAIKEAAEILGYSAIHTARKSRALDEGDVYALIDKRKGQKTDYLFSAEIKAELVQQFAANAVTNRPTTSRAISEQVNERCGLSLPDRSVRLHMNRLGLSRISESLPALVQDLKKSSKP